MYPPSYIWLMPTSLVTFQTPACVVTATPRSRATSKAAFSGKPSTPGRSKAIWKPSMSPLPSIRRCVEVAELRCGGPFPRALVDVAVGEHEPAGHLFQRVDRGVGVLGRLQAVRPVDAGGHPGVDRLDGRQQVARVVVLRAELLAPAQVVVDEVLGERPVGAVPAHGRLPHVPVGVDHARHDDAARGVDDRGALRHLEVLADRGDPLAGNQDIRVVEDRVRVVHRQHGRIPEHDRLTRLRSRCSHEETSTVRRSAQAQVRLSYMCPACGHMANSSAKVR